MAYDTERKPAYGAAGIPEVWIVNLNADCIDRHITPTSHGYRLRERLVLAITWPQGLPDAASPSPTFSAPTRPTTSNAN
ncbi:MAG: hypothetical protein R2838_07355 [Caldilineaceae bacterium]